jgi:hypothetical protein
LWAMYIFNYVDRTNIGVSCPGPSLLPEGTDTALAEREDGRYASGSQAYLVRLLACAVNLLHRDYTHSPSRSLAVLTVQRGTC